MTQQETCWSRRDWLTSSCCNSGLWDGWYARSTPNSAHAARAVSVFVRYFRVILKMSWCQSRHPRKATNPNAFSILQHATWGWPLASQSRLKWIIFECVLWHPNGSLLTLSHFRMQSNKGRIFDFRLANSRLPVTYNSWKWHADLGIIGSCERQ